MRNWLVRAAGWLARRSTLVIVAAMAVIAGLELWIGLRQSVWFDEAFSILLAQHGWHDMFHYISVDIHPPLYYVLLKLWIGVFGSSDLALRSLSVLCSAGAAGIGLAVVRRLFGRRVMLVTVPFVICAPLALRYGFEIRMYALVSLIGMAATYVLLRARSSVAHNRLWWTLYAVLVAAGMYSLYYSAFIWIAHVVFLSWLAWQERGKKPLRTLQWPWAFVAAVVLFVPWLPVMHSQLSDVQNANWYGPVGHRDIMNLISFTLSALPEWNIIGWQSALTLGAAGLIVYLVIKAFHVAPRERRPGLVLLTCLALSAPVIMFVASLPPLKPLFVERYIAHTVVAVYLLIGVSLAYVARARAVRLRYLAIITVILMATLVEGVGMLSYRGNFLYQRMRMPRAKQIAAYIQANEQPGDVVVIDEPQIYFELRHYLPNAPLRYYDRDGAVGARLGYAMIYHNGDEVRTSSDITAPRVWLVYSGVSPAIVPPSNYLKGRSLSIDTYNAYVATEYTAE